MCGKCTLKVRMKNHGEYLKWCKYINANNGRQWEFQHTYPAVMVSQYVFENSLDVEVLAKRIVQLMEMGFEVYSANWEMAYEKSQLEQPL